VTVTEFLSQSNSCLTAAKLAKLLSVHKLTIYRATKAGRLKGFYVGASLRFEPSAVAAWLDMRGAR
jgi:excisionase family DNA binding protein